MSDGGKKTSRNPLPMAIRTGPFSLTGALRRSGTLVARHAGVALFPAFLAYFVLGTGWYPRCDLVIGGRAPLQRAEIEVLWDSGHGYNDYERRRLSVDTRLPEGEREHAVEIRYTGEKNEASDSAHVVCRGISVDGKPLALSQAVSGSFVPRAGGLVLRRAGDRIVLRVPAARNIHIGLVASAHSGVAAITVNGRTRRHDLYARIGNSREAGFDYWVVGPAGRFEVRLAMPRYALEGLVVRCADPDNPCFPDTVTMTDGRREKRFPVDSAAAVSTLSFGRPVNRGFVRHFDPSRFAWQLAFAAVSAWLAGSLKRAACRYSGARELFFGGGRPLFWILLGGALAAWTFWLLAFWPGVMSVDSLKIWRAAKFPDVTLSDHPPINEWIYFYLMSLWDHPAVVPAVQILLTATLTAWIFHRVREWGAPVGALLPFYLLVILSVPIGVYTVTLWKDIPFALLVAFWGFFLALRHREPHRRGRFSAGTYAALAALFVAMLLVRYNGILFVVLIPPALYLLDILSLKKLVLCLLVAPLVAVAAVHVVLEGGRDGGVRTFFARQTSHFLGRLSETPVENRLKFVAGNYFGIFDINQRVSRWDLWHDYWYDRMAYPFLLDSGWSDAYPYLDPRRHPFQKLHSLGKRIYRRSLTEPWVEVSWNPFYLLALFPVALLFFRYLPRSAIYAGVTAVQIAGLLFLLQILNWRYYYFAYLSAMFLPAVMLGEALAERRRRLRPEA